METNHTKIKYIRKEEMKRIIAPHLTRLNYQCIYVYNKALEGDVESLKGGVLHGVGQVGWVTTCPNLPFGSRTREIKKMTKHCVLTHFLWLPK